MPTYTSTLNLRKFAYDERGWGKGWRENLDILDGAIGRGYTPVGPDASKPASPSVGDTYIASDTGIFYKCLSAGVWTGTIVPAEIPAGSINTDHIAAGAVGSGHIAAGAVGSSHIAAGAVGSSHIASGGVDNAALGADAVVNAALAAAGVDTAALADLGVVTAALSSNAITSDKLASGATVEVASAVLTATTLSTTSTTFVDITGLSVTMTFEDGIIIMIAHIPLVSDGSYTPIYLDFTFDGTRVAPGDGMLKTKGEVYSKTYTMVHGGGVSAGSHTVAVQWRVATGTGYIDLTGDNETVAALYVIHLKR